MTTPTTSKKSKRVVVTDRASFVLGVDAVIYSIAVVPDGDASADRGELVLKIAGKDQCRFGVAGLMDQPANVGIIAIGLDVIELVLTKPAAPLEVVIRFLTKGGSGDQART